MFTFLLGRAYRYTRAAEIRGGLLHAMKKGQVCPYFCPLKINNHRERKITAVNYSNCAYSQFVWESSYCLLHYTRLQFMPTSLNSCRVVSLGCFRFSPQVFTHRKNVSLVFVMCCLHSHPKSIINTSWSPAWPRTNYAPITFESITLCPGTTNSAELKGIGAT